jgi:hypothetical protein
VPLERRPQYLVCLLLMGVVDIRREAGIRLDTQRIPDSNPEASSFLSLSFSALVIPRQSTGTRNYMQASIGRTTNDRVRFKPGKDIDNRTRGRAIILLEYD